MKFYLDQGTKLVPKQEENLCCNELSQQQKNPFVSTSVDETEAPVDECYRLKDR